MDIIVLDEVMCLHYIVEQTLSVYGTQVSDRENHWSLHKLKNTESEVRSFSLYYYHVSCILTTLLR